MFPPPRDPPLSEVRFELIESVDAQWAKLWRASWRHFASALVVFGIQLLLVAWLVLAGGRVSALWTALLTLVSGALLHASAPWKLRRSLRAFAVHTTMDSSGVCRTQYGVCAGVGWASVSELSSSEEGLTLSLGAPEPLFLPRPALRGDVEWDRAMASIQALRAAPRAVEAPPRVNATWLFDPMRFGRAAKEGSLATGLAWVLGFAIVAMVTDYMMLMQRADLRGEPYELPLAIFAAPLLAAMVVALQVARGRVAQARAFAKYEAHHVGERVYARFDEGGLHSTWGDTWLRANWSAVREHRWSEAGATIYLRSGHVLFVPAEALEPELRSALEGWLASVASPVAKAPPGGEGRGGPWEPPSTRVEPPGDC